MKKEDAIRRAPMIHVRVTEEDIKKLDELTAIDTPFNSRARVVRQLIRDAWKSKQELKIDDATQVNKTNQPS